MKRLLEIIHNSQLETFITVDNFLSMKPLRNKTRGLYWFWTNMPFSELATTVVPHKDKQVPIKDLIEIRLDLKCVCSVKRNDEFRIVYNGIGGYDKVPPSSGLKERIKQEISGSGPTVGTLGIKYVSHTCRWGISYFDFDDVINDSLLRTYFPDYSYKTLSRMIENAWRLEFGTPILNRF